MSRSDQSAPLLQSHNGSSPPAGSSTSWCQRITYWRNEKTEKTAVRFSATKTDSSPISFFDPQYRLTIINNAIGVSFKFGIPHEMINDTFFSRENDEAPVDTIEDTLCLTRCCTQQLQAALQDDRSCDASENAVGWEVKWQSNQAKWTFHRAKIVSKQEKKMILNQTHWGFNMI